MRARRRSALENTNTPVAVLGGGVSGRAAAGLLRRLGKTAEIFDERGGDRGCAGFRPAPGEYALAVVSPGFRPGHPWRRLAREAGIPVEGETEFAAAFWPGRLLCVTGTNGKTTLARFLEKALRANGESARACGNIGLPLSALCDGSERAGDIAVCETSSFQLYDWARPRCEAAFWTNFAPDHLDWHESTAGYFAAKWRLVGSGAPVFAGATVRDHAMAAGMPVPGNLRVAAPLPPGAAPAEGFFARPPFDSLYALAAAWWRSTGRPEAVPAETARVFEPPPHRMESLGTAAGLSFVNDSKATNFHAALAAVRALPGPIRWIGGGSDKGEDPAALAAGLADRIASADTFGATGRDLADGLRAAGVPAGRHDSLAAAFGSAVARARPGDTVLLSPGFASFDQFSGYAERGDAFRAAVRDLALSPGTKID
ncbi:MAG: Mur ligase family protein [Puniceicoccaceae bacterium]